MKKATGTLLIIIATFYITGCKKFYDQVNKDPKQEYKYCDIKKFKVWFQDTYNEFNVTYNNKGQPKDVIGIYPDTPFTSPNFDQHFRYDKKSRLTDWLYNSPGTQQVYVWERFYYLSANRILDSSFGTYGMGIYISDANPTYPFMGPTRVRYFDLDNYGRIIKITTEGSSFVYNYIYGANGNSNAFNSYDSAVNLMRTNDIWMFVGVNYNVNNNYDNPWGTNVFTYNSYMLPTSIQMTNGEAQQYMTTFVFNKMVIEYDCKGNPKFY